MDIQDKIQGRPVILLSLREAYFLDMIRQKKCYEYRKRFVKEAITALIYISKSRRELAGVIEFGRPYFGTSAEIAELTEPGDAKFKVDLAAYFAPKGVGYAALVRHLYCMERPLTLADLREIEPAFTPPQSYAYLREHSPLYAALMAGEYALRQIF